LIQRQLATILKNQQILGKKENPISKVTIVKSICPIFNPKYLKGIKEIQTYNPLKLKNKRNYS
jgi:hypothetical protein